MNTSSEIWFAFARTFSVLFLVLALLIFAFYLIKKFSTAKGLKNNKNFIKILSVHHLSPKEKLALVTVLDKTILIGVTPANISKLSSFDKDMAIFNDLDEAPSKFSDFLTQKIGNTLKNRGNGLLKKGEK